MYSIKDFMFSVLINSHISVPKMLEKRCYFITVFKKILPIIDDETKLSPTGLDRNASKTGVNREC